MVATLFFVLGKSMCRNGKKAKEWRRAERRYVVVLLPRALEQFEENEIPAGSR